MVVLVVAVPVQALPLPRICDELVVVEAEEVHAAFGQVKALLA